MKTLSFLWQIFYDHWLILASLSGATVVTVLKNKLPQIANFEIPLWMLLVIFFILVALWYAYEKLFCDKQSDATVIHKKPEEIVQSYEPEIYASVAWKVWMGTGDNFSDRRIWVDGPFCPHCDYEMDKYEKSWLCVPCNKKFKIPSQIREYTKEKIIKVFTAKADKVGMLRVKVN